MSEQKPGHTISLMIRHEQRMEQMHCGAWETKGINTIIIDFDHQFETHEDALRAMERRIKEMLNDDSR